jgi:hypothetical protein
MLKINAMVIATVIYKYLLYNLNYLFFEITIFPENNYKVKTGTD